MIMAALGWYVKKLSDERRPAMNRVTLTSFKLARMKAGLRQIDIARALGVSESLVAYWETGGKRPAEQYLPKLAEMLRTKPEDLFPEVLGDETPVERRPTTSPR